MSKPSHYEPLPPGMRIEDLQNGVHNRSSHQRDRSPSRDHRDREGRYDRNRSQSMSSREERSRQDQCRSTSCGRENSKNNKSQSIDKAVQRHPHYNDNHPKLNLDKQKYLKDVLSRNYLVPPIPDENTKNVLIRCQQDIQELLRAYNHDVNNFLSVMTLWFFCPWVMRVLTLILTCLDQKRILINTVHRFDPAQQIDDYYMIAQSVLQELYTFVKIVDDDPSDRMIGIHHCAHKYFPEPNACNLYEDRALVHQLTNSAYGRRIIAIILLQIFRNNHDSSKNRLLLSIRILETVVECLVGDLANPSLFESDEKSTSKTIDNMWRMHKKFWLVLEMFTNISSMIDALLPKVQRQILCSARQVLSAATTIPSSAKKSCADVAIRVMLDLCKARNRRGQRDSLSFENLCFQEDFAPTDSNKNTCSSI